MQGGLVGKLWQLVLQRQQAGAVWGVDVGSDGCRYISEDFGGVALHPIDVLDASTGRLLSQLVDANLSTICPVNKPHPRVDVIVSGSSRSLYAWRPVSKGELCRAGMPCDEGQALVSGAAAMQRSAPCFGSSLPV